MEKKPEVHRKELEAKFKLLDKAMGEVNKRFGNGAVMKLDRNHGAFPSRSTNLVGLDYKLGIGGIPKKGQVEIFGPPGIGKTTLAATILAAAQKRQELVLFIDVEQRADPNYLRTLGVEFEKLIFSQPTTAEETMEILSVMIQSGAIDIIVVDSVAALVPAVMMEGHDIGGQKRMAALAAIMSQSCKVLGPHLRKNNVSLIWINQTRDAIGVIYGNPETTPGGNALKFYALQRMRVSRGEKINSTTNQQIGHKVKVSIIKNNLAPPYQRWEGDLIWGVGFDTMADIVWIAKELGIVTLAGSYFKFNGETIALGYGKTVEKFKGDPELFDAVRKEVLSRLGRNEQPPNTK